MNDDWDKYQDEHVPYQDDETMSDRFVVWFNRHQSTIALFVALILVYLFVPKESKDLAGLAALGTVAYFNLVDKLDQIIRRLP